MKKEIDLLPGRKLTAAVVSRVAASHTSASRATILLRGEDAKGPGAAGHNFTDAKHTEAVNQRSTNGLALLTSAVSSPLTCTCNAYALEVKVRGAEASGDVFLPKSSTLRSAATSSVALWLVALRPLSFWSGMSGKAPSTRREAALRLLENRDNRD